MSSLQGYTRILYTQKCTFHNKDICRNIYDNYFWLYRLTVLIVTGYKIQTVLTDYMDSHQGLYDYYSAFNVLTYQTTIFSYYLNRHGMHGYYMWLGERLSLVYCTGFL